MRINYFILLKHNTLNKIENKIEGPLIVFCIIHYTCISSRLYQLHFFLLINVFNGATQFP